MESQASAGVRRVPFRLRSRSAGFRFDRREAVTLALLLVAAAVVGFLAYSRLTDLNAPAAAATSTYIPAFRRDLTSTISATGTVQANQQVNLNFGSSGEIAQVDVKAGDKVVAGQQLARLDDSQLKSSLRSAQTSLASAQARLDATVNPSAGDRAAAQQSIYNAENQLATAKQNLEDTRNKPTASDRAKAQQGVLSGQNALQSAKDARDKAQRDLTAAEKALNDAENAANVACPSNPATTCNTARAAVTQAKTTLDNARRAAESPNLDRSVESAEIGLQTALNDERKALQGATALEIQNAETSVKAAGSSLVTAQERYDELIHPAAAVVLPLQSSVDQAADNVEAAQQKLDDAVIIAPFDGVITAVNGSVGAQATGGGNTTNANSGGVVTLLNPNLIRIDASIDQTDIGSVKVGQTAVATFDALSGYTYQATVSNVGLTPSTSQGVVTYVVSFAVDTSTLAAGTPIPAPGMTASLTVTTATASNALVVPSRSVSGSGGSGAVTIKGANGNEQRLVTTGITNGTLTQITSGLEEGDGVLYSRPSSTGTSTDQQPQRGQFVIPAGGGFGGGGIQIGPR
jgi:multidrug efflux pump subunit AcrA (membrane-fusion protein)